MQCTKISPKFEFGIINPTPGSPHLKMWRLAESLQKNQQMDVGVAGVTVNK